MLIRLFALIFVIGFFTACAPNNDIPVQPALPKSIDTSTPPGVSESATPAVTSSAILLEGNPSYKVAAFYYPWYGNPEIDGEWVHWTQNNHSPPDDISSDYYPALGAYSSNDPAVVAQHMQWLRQAGIGVIISSWWGQGSREDQAVPLLLQAGEQYEIKVAFHIEPYQGRTAESLVRDIEYLYQQYGTSPAFFRSNTTSRHSPGLEPKGMFFVWSIGVKGSEGERVQVDYWQDAMDSIHALPEGALVIANTTQGSWISDGHFDGLYNYASLHLEENNGFAWARSLPPDSLYVPSVIPGFSARRVGYAEETYVARQNGKTYDGQWTAALGAGVMPELVTITSFNEWHEGSIIEPPQAGVSDSNEHTYADFSPLPPSGYLELTREWVDKYLALRWPTSHRARIKISTTSDWTTLNIVSGGIWIRPALVSASASATTTGMEDGDRFLLAQSLADASAGNQVEMIWDVSLTALLPGQELTLQIDRGNIGKSHVTIFNFTGETPMEVKTVEWDQVTSGRNSYQITIPPELLTGPTP